MLEEAVIKARRVVEQLERDAAGIDQPSSLSDEQRAEARRAIEKALAAAKALLQSLQKAAESEKLL